MNAPALATRATADPGFIDFDVIAGSAADPILIRSNHAGAELVEDLKGGFVTGKPDLALEIRKRLRKRKVIALQNIHSRFVQIPSRLDAEPYI